MNFAKQLHLLGWTLPSTVTTGGRIETRVEHHQQQRQGIEPQIQQHLPFHHDPFHHVVSHLNFWKQWYQRSDSKKCASLNDTALCTRAGAYKHCLSMAQGAHFPMTPTANDPRCSLHLWAKSIKKQKQIVKCLATNFPHNKRC